MSSKGSSIFTYLSTQKGKLFANCKRLKNNYQLIELLSIFLSNIDNIKYVLSRKENKKFLNVALSEESRIKRGRQRTVNIQMTITSWSLEFVTGVILIIVITVVQCAEVERFWPGGSFIALDAILNSIVIPSSYLLNNEVNKALIVA